jgi:CubicO group peptidase (beta-lactamase class C family)
MRIEARTEILAGWALVEFKDPTPISIQMCAPFIEARRAAFDGLWADEANWAGGFYACAADGRLWVPSPQAGEERLVRNWAHQETPAWAREWVRGLFGRRAVPAG